MFSKKKMTVSCSGALACAVADDVENDGGSPSRSGVVKYAEGEHVEKWCTMVLEVCTLKTGALDCITS
jgi:hypothetical protein